MNAEDSLREALGMGAPHSSFQLEAGEQGSWIPVYAGWTYHIQCRLLK